MKIFSSLVSFSVALSLVAGVARGGEPLPPVPIWPQVAPDEKGDFGAEAELPLKPGDTTIRTSNVTKPTLIIFRPSPEKNTGAAVVICPGGGYNILAFNKEGTEVAEWLSSIGVTGIVLKYRVPARKGLEKHTAALQDAQRALGVVRQRASEWSIDPKKIGVLGFSAGGHLATTLSNNFATRSYEPIDEADKVSCRPDFTLLIYPAYLVDKANVMAPEIKVTSETPTTFIAMTEDDGVRAEGALFYYLALKNAKVKGEMHLYPTGGHGYGLRPTEHLVSTWPQRAEQWMKTLGVLDKSQ